MKSGLKVKRSFLFFLLVFLFSGKLLADYTANKATNEYLTTDFTKVSDDKLIQMFKDSPSIGELNICQRELERRGKSEKLVTGLVEVYEKSSLALKDRPNLIFEKQEKSIVVLEEWNAKETAPQLLEMLDYHKAGMEDQSRIVLALGDFGYQPAVEKMTEFLGKTKNPLDKVSTLISLGKLDNKLAIPAIKKELDPSEEYPRVDYVQSNAVLTLAKMGDFSGHEKAKALLQANTYPEVKMAALEALAIIGDKDDLPLIDQVAHGSQAKSEQMVHDYIGIARYSIATKGMSEDQKAGEISKLLDPYSPFSFNWAMGEISKNPSPPFLKMLRKMYHNSILSKPQYSSFRQAILKELQKKGIND